MATSPSPLPSAEFMALVPSHHAVLTAQRVIDIGGALASGSWSLDTSEVDPRTGFNLVQSLARGHLFDDDARAQALGLVVKLGAAVDFRAPDGLTAWEWARKEQDRGLERQLEELGAKIPTKQLSARQMEVVTELARMDSTWRANESLVELARSSDVFGTLDAKVNGIPLGLHIGWKKLNVNGAILAGPNSDVKYLGQMDHLMHSLYRLGRAALAAEPTSEFPLWCWVAQSQAMFWIGMDASPSRKKRWAGNWTSLEKAIIKKKYPALPSSQAQASLAAAATDMVARSISEIAHESLAHQKKLQPLAAYLLVGLRAWLIQSQKLDSVAVGNGVAAAREASLWAAAARLAVAVPKEKWASPGFSEKWASAAYYALRDSVEPALKNHTDLPDFVEAPWLTLPAVLQQLEHERPDAAEHLMSWLSQTPAPDAQKEMGLAMLSHQPDAAAMLRQKILEESLNDSTAPPSRPSPHKARM